MPNGKITESAKAPEAQVTATAKATTQPSKIRQ
jgi:hypothetical protein